MSDVTLPAFSICPFRSSVLPPEERKIAIHGAPPPEPKQILAPCLYAGCGLFVATEVDHGKITNGMCAMRAIAGTTDSIASSLAQLVKLSTAQTIAGGSTLLGAERKG